MRDEALALAERVEWASADMFWAAEGGEVDALRSGGAVYAASARRSVLYNTVARVRASGAREAEALVAEVVAAHAAKGHDQTRWCVMSYATSPELEAALERAGFAPGDVHDVRVLRVAPEADEDAGVSGDWEAREVTTLHELRLLYGVMRRAFGGLSSEPTRADLERELRQCTGAERRVARVVAYDRATGRPGCSGGMTLDRSQGVGLLWAGGTSPEARGRGAYRATIAARVAIARAAGLDSLGVFAKTTTSSPILAKLGFASVAQMTYWERPR